MRKINVLAILVLVSAIGFLSSCTKDSTEDLTPTMTFVTSSGFTSADVTLNAGEIFKVGITATANVTSGKNLEKFKVVRTFNSTPFTVVDSLMNKDNFSIELTANAYPEVGTENWTFTITDKDGQSKELSFNITTVATAGDITTYSDVILGSYDNNDYGSSFASSTGVVFEIADAKINSSKIDWIYFYGVGNLATLAAPDNAEAATIFTGINGLSSWATRNATRFTKVTTSVVWDNITDDSQITVLAAASSESKSNLLHTGDFLAFKTVAGKMGLIKINSIVAGAAGSINYAVKVQK